ncbi:TRAP transporter small permease subunit [Stappia taiwanensis]|uniref:TRAP transporter small permease protein n=1 Tax=Stappia taiwanensis TaxID=992267 RepID=A0A838XWY7_9HYPH|nr:TRAP transporter small permease subunit [Stappia taiwanensis]MBA4611320.1 TRAP transporter small permease subunit [Stappia taiwanensis]GGE87786.1 C4-dicarboxylate ABC transporter [Stappia taiwanensis]
MQALARAVTTMNRALFSLTKWLVYVIAALMLFEVVSRYSLANPTSWGPELATLLFGPFFLLGGPYLLHTGGHVAVDILSARATGRTARALAALAALMALLFGGILFWFALPLAMQSFEYGETSYSAWNPVIWPTKAVLPLAALLLMLQALAELIFVFSPKDAA